MESKGTAERKEKEIEGFFFAGMSMQKKKKTLIQIAKPDELNIYNYYASHASRLYRIITKINE